MSFSIFGLTFYFYGLIIAVAIFIAVYLIEIKSKKLDISEKYFWNLVFWILLGGVIGARVWHLITDFHLYVDNFWGIFKIWDGGLSILGAIFGGVLSLRLVSRGSRIKHVLSLSNVSGMTLWVVLDLAIFGLPFGQAIGRLANYFNQELYGWPTNLPWAIYINPENRALRFKEFGYYHPLFAYEALATFSFG
ncbi:MAG: prolipoprotein diacylglyceryl transferase, partial [Patescibacteria group bacterium]